MRRPGEVPGLLYFWTLIFSFSKSFARPVDNLPGFLISAEFSICETFYEFMGEWTVRPEIVALMA